MILIAFLRVKGALFDILDALCNSKAIIYIIKIRFLCALYLKTFFVPFMIFNMAFYIMRTFFSYSKIIKIIFNNKILKIKSITLCTGLTLYRAP